jgi:hypothetical protein
MWHGTGSSAQAEPQTGTTVLPQTDQPACSEVPCCTCVHQHTSGQFFLAAFAASSHAHRYSTMAAASVPALPC